LKRLQKEKERKTGKCRRQTFKTVLKKKNRRKLFIKRGGKKTTRYYAQLNNEKGEDY
jgi:hypothetical protein